MPLIDSKTALARFDNDTEIYIDLIDTFLDMGSVDFETLRTELSTGKNSIAAHRIHQLKGAALTLGADQLAHSCSLLEAMILTGAGGNYLQGLEEVMLCYQESIEELTAVRSALKKQA
jgi:HPt (histidine-containing phosphotransfer) domain-containing protein